MAGRATSLVSVLVFVDPALHPDDSVNGLGFGESIVNGDTESLKRHLAFAIPFGTSNVSTTETTGATDTDSIGTEVHGGLDGALHGAAESNTTLKLNANVFANALRVEFGLADLDDVDFHLGTTGDLGDRVGHEFDLGTFASDDESRSRGVQSNPDTVPGTFDDYLRNGDGLKAIRDILSNFKVFVKLVGVVLAFGVPLGAPVFVDGEAEADWINFLSHDS